MQGLETMQTTVCPSKQQGTQGGLVLIQGSWLVIDLCESFGRRYEVLGDLWLDGEFIRARVRDYATDYRRTGFDRLDPVRWWIPCGEGAIKSFGQRLLEVVTHRQEVIKALVRCGLVTAWHPDRKYPATVCRLRFEPRLIGPVGRIMQARIASHRGRPGRDRAMDSDDLWGRVARTIEAQPLVHRRVNGPQLPPAPSSSSRAGHTEF